MIFNITVQAWQWTSFVFFQDVGDAFKSYHYIVSSVSGQDESKPALWLASWVGKMELSYPLGTTRRVPQKKFPRKSYNKSFIDQGCSVKMAWYWPRSLFASLWTSTLSRSINMQKKNLANIQPSWPNKLGQWSLPICICQIITWFVSFPDLCPLPGCTDVEDCPHGLAKTKFGCQTCECAG